MQSFPKHTKIVATIGPATETEETIAELIKAGMNVARFNTKHGTPEWHRERIQRVRTVAREMDTAVGILLDLQGPEIRINLPNEANFELTEGDEAVFASDERCEEKNLMLIPQIVVETLDVGHFVMLDDGIGELEIVRKTDTCLYARALSDFPVKHRKTLNTPGVIIDMPSLIEADLVQLDGMHDEDIDFVGLSFVRDSHDIAILRQELDKRGLHADIIAKIENQAALNNLDEIIAAADAVMVARGDLAVEVPFEELSYWQKKIIKKCRLVCKPVITATQMLKSMVENPRPTRAEVTDVANAVYDGTDAVMLSEETTIGKYPVRAVATQAKIVAYNERHAQPTIDELDDKLQPTTSTAVTRAGISLLQHAAVPIAHAVCLTERGETALSLARYRPHTGIIAITSTERTRNKLTLVYGVRPFILGLPDAPLEAIQRIVTKFLSFNIITQGDTILFMHGIIWKQPGYTNSLSVFTVPGVTERTHHE